MALVVWLTGAAEDSAVQKDKLQLQGGWSMVACTMDGHIIPPKDIPPTSHIYNGDEVTTTVGGRPYFKERITIDPSKNPKTIDFEIIGESKPSRKLGIYEFDGDRLKLCLGKPGAERPTDFSSKTGEGRTLSEWKREKPPGPTGDSK